MHRVGQEFHGKRYSYTITDIHVVGGQAQILHAQTRRGECVVIKVPLPHCLRTKRSHEQLRRETRFLRRLTDIGTPGVVAYIDHGTWKNNPFLACQLLIGRTLEAVFMEGPVPLIKSLRWLISLCNTVEMMHRSGIVHADLSARNVMICDDTPVIIDLGISREVHEPMTHAGSIGYLPPEILMAMHCPTEEHTLLKDGGRSQDTYALGILLYEMLTGRPPFRIGETAVNPWYAMAYQHMSVDPPPVALEYLTDRTARKVNRLIQGMLAKDPDKRLSLNRVKVLAKDILQRLGTSMSPRSLTRC